MKALVRKLVNSVGYDIRRLNHGSSQGSGSIHFLHIGKNAGTQVSNIAKQINAASNSRKILHRAHGVYLKDIPSGDDYFFSIRNPISRFKSGFYSRKRKGQPRLYSEWTSYEELAFLDFEHANDLAENLFEPGEDGRKAWAAMKSVRHTAQNQCDWFYCFGNFLKVRPPIWVIRQESFDEDMKKFISLAVPEVDVSTINFVFDEISSHKNDYAGIPPLSPKAEENLRAWYAQDFAFYAMCNAWLEQGE